MIHIYHATGKSGTAGIAIKIMLGKIDSLDTGDDATTLGAKDAELSIGTTGLFGTAGMGANTSCWTTTPTAAGS